MKFPNCLVKGNRSTLPQEKIKDLNYMYARHKPGVQWKEGDDFPDFATIRSKQSFNWSAYSIPVWTRFKNKKEYLNNYGVAGYSVNTIRNSGLINTLFENNTFSILHSPLDYNYSHCELNQLKDIPHKNKREIRYTFAVNCIRPIRPDQQIKLSRTLIDRLIMYYHRFLTKF